MPRRIKETFQASIKRLYRVRIKKMHLDYLAGLLSIPLIIMGLVLNFGNLHNEKSKASPTPVPPQVVIVSGKPAPVVPTINTSPQACTKTIGPISITAPQEGQTVSDNPVCITIDYSDTNYCSVVWSYRINGSSWSDYSNSAPCLYNMPNGNVKFELRVNSTASNDTKTLTRNFVYNGGNNPVVATPTLAPTSTPIASSSAN